MKYFLLTFFIVATIHSQGQNQSCSFALYKLLENPQSLKADGDIHLLVKGNISNIAGFLSKNSGYIKYEYDGIAAIRLPKNKLTDFVQISGIKKIEVSNQSVFPNDYASLEFTAVDSVHNGLGLLTKAYTGKGVIVGVIDSGIDPTHPDFKKDNGKTRILGFWDQVDTTNSTTYGYGRAYSAIDIDNGDLSTYLDTTYGGHGTAVAGFAAGGGKARHDIKGMAPEADIVVVGIDPGVLNYLNRTPSMLQIVDGIDYIFKIADAEGKPAVINISLGGIEGSHDGNDLPTQMIENMLDAKSGRALVTSAGNSANTKHHIKFEPNGDTLFTWIESMYSNSSVCKRDSGAYMSFYGDSSEMKNLKINIGAENRAPCCNILDETGFKALLLNPGQPIKDTLWDGPSILGIVTMFTEKTDFYYALFIEIDSDSMDMLWRISVTGQGKIDGWAGPTSARSCNSTYIVSETTVGSSAQIDNYFNYVRPDNEQTIGTAYAASEKVITVGAFYVRKNMRDVDSINRTYFNGVRVRTGFSSIGPNRKGVIKPDVTGPGGRVITAAASQVLNSKLLNSRSTLYLGGWHQITDGTSFASPAVAGIVALYFEKFPNASYQDVLDAIYKTAYQDALTGMPNPNNMHGYGRINAYQMLLEQPVGINYSHEMESLIFPNPSTTGIIHVQLGQKYSASKQKLKVYTLSGKLVIDREEFGNYFQLKLAVPGFYLVSIRSEDGSQLVEKVMVQ